MSVDWRSSYSEGGLASGAIEVAGGGGGDDDAGGGLGATDGASAPVVVVFADVIFDKCGFTVFGIPHILDSVVLTGLSFADGLLGLHIASFCSGVNDVLFDDVSFAWP